MPLAPSELVQDSLEASRFVGERITMALYYGCGRNDEAADCGYRDYVNADAFRTHYGRLAIVYMKGRTTYMPAVQDAWRDFTTCHGPAY